MFGWLFASPAQYEPTASERFETVMDRLEDIETKIDLILQALRFDPEAPDEVFDAAAEDYDEELDAEAEDAASSASDDTTQKNDT